MGIRLEGSHKPRLALDHLQSERNNINFHGKNTNDVTRFAPAVVATFCAAVASSPEVTAAADVATAAAAAASVSS